MDEEKSILVLLAVSRMSIEPPKDFEPFWIKHLEQSIVRISEPLIPNSHGNFDSVGHLFSFEVKKAIQLFNEDLSPPVYFWYAGYSIMKYRNGTFFNVPEGFNQESLESLKELFDSLPEENPAVDIVITKVTVSLRGVPFMIIGTKNT